MTSENNFQDAFGGMRGIDHFVKNRGKARLMLQIGAGHSNNCQVKLKLFGYDINTISSKSGGIRGINHLRYK